MRSERIRTLVEIALTVALCAVLNMLRFRLPINIAGGEISLAMVPLFIIALRRGPAVGLVAGAIWGTVDLLVEPYIVFWAQVLLDYPIAFALVGLSGLWATTYKRLIALSPLKASALAVLAMLAGGVARFASHWVSGVLFFAAYAPADQPVWLYSVVYNLSYLAPSLIGSIIVAAVVLPVLERAVPTGSSSAKG
ncbi:MAG: energy-coupled thiamine transporter ThiT [Coriobacteriia bacterium]|nr:energy-coupled thiamine transporter ThiT [Coriobacteriia bacterium]